ncbi:MAG: type II secretion system F family protein [Clostridia bacterium]
MPYIVIKFIYDKKKSDIIQIFPTYIVSLKNYTQVSNDIIVAMKKTIPPEEIKKYIETFNFSVESGISVYDAFENLKEKFNIGKINDFFSSCQYCYINGGNFTKLLDKYAKILNKRNIQIEKEKQENFSSKIVMYIMIAINIYMLFGFSFSTVEYKQIMTQTLVGKVIVNINIISYIIMFIISNKFNKVEE